MKTVIPLNLSGASALLIGITLLISIGGCDSDLPSLVSADLDTQLTTALEAAAENGQVSYFILPDSDDLASIPADPRNPLTPEKVALGRLLVHETALAVNPMHPESNGTYACSSCHFPQAGFRAMLPQGLADGGIGFGRFGERRVPNPDYVTEEIDRQPIRVPSPMNGAYQPNNLWNGQFGATGVNAGTESEWTPGTPLETNLLGYEGLETQAIAGLTVHRMHDGPASLIANYPEYATMFSAAFPGFQATRPDLVPIEVEMAGLAIASWWRTVLSNQAPFQLWLRGDANAMTDAQKRGALLFFGRANCSSCHSGPNLANMSFHALGMGELLGPGVFSDFNPKDPVHLGRASFTQRDEDSYQFKVPQLYNVADDMFLGHGSTFTSVREVVAYKNAAIRQTTNVPVDRLDSLFEPLDLSEGEIDDLTMFLERALYDPDLARHIPTTVVSGNCFPNNDPQSRIDLGCEGVMARPYRPIGRAFELLSVSR